MGERSARQEHGRTLEGVLTPQLSKCYGAVSTPPEVIRLMLRVSGIRRPRGLRILEPGCGLCVFLEAIRAAHPDNRFFGVEIQPEICRLARAAYPGFSIIEADFLLWNTPERFDLVIGNPPYGIVGDSSHYPIHVLRKKKELYKAASRTWFGKYNLYAAFIEKGVRLLRSGGRLVLVVPATFMILDDFKLLRRFLADSGKTRIYYLGGGVFPGRNVSACVLVVESGSSGLELYEVCGLTRVRRCLSRPRWRGEMIRFEDDATVAFEQGKPRLGEFFDLHFAARSTEFRRHPEVRRAPAAGLVPVLCGRNLRPGRIEYDKCYCGFWMPRESAPSLRRFYGTPHVVVGHTKGARVVAAVDKACYPWKEEIHLVARPGHMDLDDVVRYLNSEDVQEYMQRLYRDITPHVTISQLAQLPMPAKFASCLPALFA